MKFVQIYLQNLNKLAIFTNFYYNFYLKTFPSWMYSVPDPHFTALSSWKLTAGVPVLNITASCRNRDIMILNLSC